MPTSAQQFDVIVVGSGASGGWAAKRLSEAGVKVAILEAGKPQGDKDFTEHVPAWDLKYRNRADEWMRRTRPRQRDCYACREWNYKWFANDLEEPYTTPADKPFSWQGRMRVVGGRTNVWGRQSYRLSQQDLKGKSFDGYGDDWPLEYADLAPYYDIVEDYVGISGQNEGVAELPDGKFLPPMAMSCAETQLRTRVKQKLGNTVTIGRTANLSKPINGRAQCHYCGPCEQGCVTHSYFNSAFTTVADALKSGNTTLITNAMVYRVLMDPDKNVANGVMYIDRVTHEVKEVRARVVILCAQALESTRILLNSTSTQYPSGLANSSGALGHYLMDHVWVAGGARGEFPDAVGPKPSLNAPKRPTGIYAIRMHNTANGPRSKDFIRGFGFQGGGATDFNMNAPGYGAAFKKGVFDPVTSVAPRRLRRGARALGQLRRDRQERRRQVRHPRPPPDDVLGREREEADPRDGADGDRDDGSGRREEHHAVPGPEPCAGLRHPRDGHGAHGRRPEDVGAQRVLPDARRQEPLRHRRVRLRLQRLPEPDADDHGADRPRDGSPDAGNEGGKRLKK